MRADFWLAQPNTGRKLRRLLRAVSGLCAAWALAAAYGLWSGSRALANERTALETLHQRAEEMTADLRAKRADAAQAVRLQTAAPAGAGSAAFADELTGWALAAGTRLMTLRVDAGSEPVAPHPAAPAGNSPGAANANAAGNIAPVKTDSDAWQHAPFECVARGSYEALMDFLDRLRTSPRLIEINLIEFSRLNTDPRTGAVRLQLTLKGTLYGLPERP